MSTQIHPKRVWAECVAQTAEFVRGAGFTDVVIGLSGGLDSSVVAAMAVDALGAEHVHGVLLPGPYSSQSSIDDALQLAANIGIATMAVPIAAPYGAFATVISEAMGKPLSGLASENTQARCRMVALMALSNANGWMMLNTGNKSEACMGYSTLYGDTSGAFAPIGGIYKTDVFRLAEWRNEEALRNGQVAPIPQNVIEKPPSAELSEGQTDEASMGIDYATLDAILALYVDKGMDVDQVVEAGFDAAQVDMVARRYAANAFKRAIEPPFAQI